MGKGSTWEGGIREAGFAHWRGVIPPFSRSAEIVSSMDVFPTALELAGLPLPSGRPIDGRSFRDVIMNSEGKSRHKVRPPRTHTTPCASSNILGRDAIETIGYNWDRRIAASRSIAVQARSSIRERPHLRSRWHSL